MFIKTKDERTKNICHHLSKLVQKNNIDFPFNKLFNQIDNNFKNNPVDSYTLPNGDKVVISSLDNMPYIVPDMSLFQAMPNPGYDKNINSLPRQRLPGDIPNGAIPFRIIVSK